MNQEDRLVVIRGKEFQMLLSLADPITKVDALKYSTVINNKLKVDIEKHLWWKLGDNDEKD